MTTDTISQHIVSTPDVLGGKPRIAGHRIAVQHVVIWHDRLGMIADEIATEYGGRLKVVKVDVDENQEIAERYGVQSIPTLLLFKDGKAVERLIGAYPKQAMVTKIKVYL